jgi:hypothetical protein
MIAGKYTGYQAVETGETIWSKYARKRKYRHDNTEGISIILIDGEQFFDSDACDADRGYLSMHMWEDNYLRAPSCYHKACWEAVGKPMGFRGASFRSQDQGFGGNNSLNRTGGFDGAQYGDVYLTPPKPKKAMELWAIHSIFRFLILVDSWARACEHAEEQRDMWRRFDEAEKRMRELEEQYPELKEKNDARKR